MTTYTDIFSGDVIYPAYVSYESISLTADTSLSWPTQFQNTANVVSAIMDISPDASTWTLTLPDATQTSVGQSFLVNNPTGFTFDLADNAGGIIVDDFPITSTFYFYLIDNSTPAGQWRQTPFGLSATVVTSIAASSSTPNITITGSPVTTSGTFVFDLGADLAALAGFSASTGIAARTAADTWALRTITGTTNQISVASGGGVTGNPTLSLAPTIDGITSLTVGNLLLSANTLSAINANGDVTITPNGTGLVELSSETHILAGNAVKFIAPTGSNYIGFSAGNMSVVVDLTWPTVAPLSGQALAFTGAGALGWVSVSGSVGASTVNAIAKYVDLVGGLQDSGILIDASNNVTGATSYTAGNIEIGLITSSTISTTTANSDLLLTPNGVGNVVFNSPAAFAAENEARWFNTADTFYAGLKASGAQASSVIWTLPLVDSAGSMVSDGAGNLSFAATGGSVTSVATGTGLTGGPITTSGTIDLTNTTVVAGNYTNPTLDIDAQGRITGASSSGASVTSVSGSGSNQIIASPTSGDVILTLAAEVEIGTSVSLGLGAIGAPSYAFTSDADTGMWNSGTNTLEFSTNGFRALQLSPSPALSVNYLSITSSATGDPVLITAEGTDANIEILLEPKGTGAVGTVKGFTCLTGSDMRFNNAADTFYAGFSAGAMGVSVDWILPLTDSTGTQGLVSDGAGTLSWLTLGLGTVTSVATGTGLTGGPITASGTIDMANTAVTPGSYTTANITVDAQGRLTAASTGPGGVASVTGTANEVTASPITGAVVIGLPSDVTVASTISLDSGTVGAPGYTFTGDSDTGVWNSAADTIDFSTNGFRALQLAPSPASAANYIILTSSSAGGTPVIETAGTSSSVGLTILTKGGAGIRNGTGGEGSPSYTFTGDTNTGMFSSATNSVDFSCSGKRTLRLLNAGSAVNYWTMTQSSTGNPVILSALGNNSNISLHIRPRGTGNTFTDGNLGVGADTFGTSATNTLSITSGTAPTTGPVDTVQIYSSDLSAGNTMLSVYTEGTSINVAAPPAADRTIAIRINGTIYYIAATLTAT